MPWLYCTLSSAISKLRHTAYSFPTNFRRKVCAIEVPFQSCNPLNKHSMKTNSSFFKNSVFGVSLLAFLLIAAGCTHDSVGVSRSDDAESLNMVSARGKKARPIKATLFNFADPNEQDVLICSPQEFGFPLTRNIIGGRMSHLGKLQQGVSHAETGDMLSGSFGVPVTCDIYVVTFRELVTTSRSPMSQPMAINSLLSSMCQSSFPIPRKVAELITPPAHLLMPWTGMAIPSQ